MAGQVRLTGGDLPLETTNIVRWVLRRVRGWGETSEVVKERVGEADIGWERQVERVEVVK